MRMTYWEIRSAFAVCLSFATIAIGAVPEGWTHLGGDAAHSARALSAPQRFDDVAWMAAPVIEPTALEEFVFRSGVVVHDDRVIVTARRYEDDGFGGFEHTSNVVICYDAANGERLWDTPIDADVFGLDSRATPAIDVRNGTVIVASHFSVYAIALADGAVVWERVLPKVLVNASPTVSGDLERGGVPANRVFITDYTGGATSGGGLYAINTSPFDATGNPYQPGDIVWQENTLAGTSGNTVAYGGGYVYVATTGGIIRRYEAICGGTCGQLPTFDWETDTLIAQVQPSAGFYGGVMLHGNHLYAAGYTFFGSGNTSRLFKIAAGTGELVWEHPCERTTAMPIVTEDGTVFLSAGIDGFGSAVKIQAFHDNGATATLLWDSHSDTAGGLTVGGWTHQPMMADGVLYCGAPDDSVLFGPYQEMYALDVSKTPVDPEFVIDVAAGAGGTAAAHGGRLFSLGVDGLIAYATQDDRGDLNCDGVVDAQDVSAMSLGLIDPVGYAIAYPDCNLQQGDLNRDGSTDGRDLAGFVGLLLGGV